MGSIELEGDKHTKLAEQLLGTMRMGGDMKLAVSPAPLRTRSVEYTMALSLTWPGPWVACEVHSLITLPSSPSIRLYGIRSSPSG
mmetsp:Transcript_5832/g.12743  ORF Transcript_5832/g.12743 Transcript_5832/m.12743 type:complete len:85 (+) Transcript_5832:572-826(+)